MAATRTTKKDKVQQSPQLQIKSAPDVCDPHSWSHFTSRFKDTHDHFPVMTEYHLIQKCVCFIDTCKRIFLTNKVEFGFKEELNFLNMLTLNRSLNRSGSGYLGNSTSPNMLNMLKLYKSL